MGKVKGKRRNIRQKNVSLCASRTENIKLTMKRYCIFCLLLLVLVACGKKTATDVVRLSGEIKGLGDDTLYLIGMDRLFDRVDTLVVRADKFDDTLSVDTLVAVRLLFGNGAEHPLYMDRGEHISVRGSADSLSLLEVSGNLANEEQTAFQRGLDSLDFPSSIALRREAQRFIEEHPASLVSVYLLDKYFVQIPNPDRNRIVRLAEPLTGDLKDRPYLNDLLTILEEDDDIREGRTLPFFQTTDADGKRVVRTQFKDQCLLVHLWASWDEASRIVNDSLRALYKRQKKNKSFAMLGISLDLDRDMWLEAVRQDTLDWDQACDLEGWEADVVKKLGVRSLPYNVLVSPQGRILGFNLMPYEVEKEIKKEKDNK